MVADKGGEMSEEDEEPSEEYDGGHKDVFQGYQSYGCPYCSAWQRLCLEMYGIQAEDILENYDSDDRPESRLGYQNSSSLDEDWFCLL